MGMWDGLAILFWIVGFGVLGPFIFGDSGSGTFGAGEYPPIWERWRKNRDQGGDMEILKIECSDGREVFTNDFILTEIYKRISSLEAELAAERKLLLDYKSKTVDLEWKLAAERRWRKRMVAASATSDGRCVVGAVAEIFDQLASDDKHRVLAKMLHDTAKAIEAPVE